MRIIALGGKMRTTSKMVLKKKLLKYRRWLEYIPEFWNIEKILSKSIKDLTVLEISYLQQIKKDHEQAEIFTKFIKIIDYYNRNKKISKEENEEGDFFTEIIVSIEESKELDLAIKKFEFKQQAEIKLELNILIDINNIINLYDGKNKEELQAKIISTNNNYFIEYGLFLLEEKAFEHYKKYIRKI